jgi:hypothetical protein
MPLTELTLYYEFFYFATQFLTHQHENICPISTGRAFLLKRNEETLLSIERELHYLGRMWIKRLTELCRLTFGSIGIGKWSHVYIL